MSQQEVDDVRRALRMLSDILPGKVKAYGAAHNRQPGMWHSILADYRQPDGNYLLPHALIGHLPRITRVFDRMCRIVANPEQDLLGEDPWLDAAGDCIAGAAMGVRRRPFDARGPLPPDSDLPVTVAGRQLLTCKAGHTWEAHLGADCAECAEVATDEEVAATQQADTEREGMVRDYERYTHGVPEDPDA